MSEANFLKKVRAIELASRRLVQEGISGDYRSAFKGTGMQFKEFRNYVYGDDVRHISWNASAKTRDPVLKTFEEERERHLFFLVDVSASLRKGPWAAAKAERLAEIAGVLCVSAAQAKDQFGLLMFSDHVEKVVPAGKGKTHLLRVIRDVLHYEPQGIGTDPDLALSQIEHIQKKQSIVVMLTDLERLPTEKTLKRISSKHEFLCVAVENPWEQKFVKCGFVELETAEQMRPVTVDTLNNKFLSYMEEDHSERKEKSIAHFRKAQSDLLWISSEEDYIPPLRNFFRRKARR